MAKYVRTSGAPSIYFLRKVLAIVGLAVIAAFSAFAQQGSRSNQAQAALHLRINIVPVLMSPTPSAGSKIALASPVSYQVSTMSSGMDMTEEIHPLFLRNADKTERVDGAVLKTLTIVLH